MPNVDKAAVVEKIIGMFRPHCGGGFLKYDSDAVICGPDDRAMIGMSTHFPVEWLVEDWGFTEDEAVWFIAEVKRLNAVPAPE